jgi:hypothetical protein
MPHRDDENRKSNNKNESNVLESLDTKLTKQNSENGDNTSNTGSTTRPVEWSPENELIMVEWCDVAQCYKWLNARSHQKFSNLNAWFTIPAIVLSTISGTASFAQTSLPLEYQTFSPMAIGAINIFIGILTTVQQYLKIAELNEAHRVSSISWDKFSRNIRIELAKRPEERMDAGHFLKLCRQEFDRLMETSPIIQDDIIKEFNYKFQGKPGSPERERFEQLKKPDICDIIVSANETRHQWYLEIDKQNNNTKDIDLINAEDEIKTRDELIRQQQDKINETNSIMKLKDSVLKQKDNIIRERNDILKEKDEEMRKKQLEEQEKLIKHNQEIEMSFKLQEESENIYKEKSKCLFNYVERFEEVYQRKPHPDEINDNMKGELDNEVLIRFLLSYSADENV